MRQYVWVLDLKDDTNLIDQYLKAHKQVWPEVLESIAASGILRMEIYHVATRLVMIAEAADDFSFEKKARMDQENNKVQEWESLMDQYQQQLPFAVPQEKWVLMKKIFEL